MLDFSDLGCVSAALGFFEEISAIPHGSGNTDKIADYLEGFARERGLEYFRDSANNVVIKKPATKGYESRPTVILQGHHDMVAEKAPDSDKDMTKEGLELYRDGDFLKARGTTLGGDDGVAVAYALALLDGDCYEHPDLECIFTSDEEIGLLGAVALDCSDIKGRMLINIDSDEEGFFTVGCAGGMRSDISLKLDTAPSSGRAYRITLGGFKGGHSGVEIDKGRENAVKTLFKLLAELKGIRLCGAEGGNADNAIPRECRAVFTSEGDVSEAVKTAYLDVIGAISEIEPDAFYELTECECTDALTADATEKAIELINALPSGVMAMSEDIEGLVQTSLNLGILRLAEGKLSASFSVRSAKGAEKRALGNRLANIAADFGASYSERGEYPAWEYKKDSHLRDVMVSVYEKLYGKKPTVLTIHAGLECGLFCEKMEGLDCVSIGPDNKDIHTTEERLSLSSTKRVWEFLLEVLKSV